MGVCLLSAVQGSWVGAGSTQSPPGTKAGRKIGKSADQWQQFENLG